MATEKGSRRKRKRSDDEPSGALQPLSEGRPTKQRRGADLQAPDAVKHALLAQYYPKVQTLRAWVLEQLPASSKLRRRKIAALGSPSRTSQPALAERELLLARLLDSTLVGVSVAVETQQPDERWEKWTSYSQKGDESYVTLSDGIAGALFSQSEIVDFVIWLLFEGGRGKGTWPKHLLCDGFRKSVGPKPLGDRPAATTTVPGLFAVHRNFHVQKLKESPWPELLALLGRSGEKIMIDLLLDCSLFLSVEAGRGNYHQLSGKPMFDLEPRSASPKPSGQCAERPPSEIMFVRSRMLYARAALNARGLVNFGLRHIHVLNRFPCNTSSIDVGDAQDTEQDEALTRYNERNTSHVMMYIFPRQFGLHNVFISTVDMSKTAQKFQDYTLREEEIAKKYASSDKGSVEAAVRVPRRLRGAARDLVKRLLVLHSRCSYSELLQYYCPVPAEHCAKIFKGHSGDNAGNLVPTHDKQGRNRRNSQPAVDGGDEPVQVSSLVDLTTPIAHVSAFCQAVFKKIIPNDFWGSGAVQAHNRAVFLKNVDQFTRLRRFEAMNLHDMSQGLKITDIGWLAPPGMENQKTSQTDLRKRREIFHEFLYYLVDSLLIPLIRSNFYVTESNTHKYRLFFFRHDIWRYIAEPPMAALKTKMLEEVKLDDALLILRSRQLGFSQVRLLPKASSMRPIMNLRRRTLVKGARKILGPSINTILGPVGTMLKAEKMLNPGRLGSSMFSVGDIYSRLRDFKQGKSLVGQKFYFAKVDVQAAFDTIPQEAVVGLMKDIPSSRRYNMVKHVEIRSSNNTFASGSATGAKSTKRWRSTAKAEGDASGFLHTVENQFAVNKKDTVFVDSVVQKTHDARALLGLMASHIQQNLVKIGKKYYRQKDGIPQGSVLSSILCNYFYAHLETRHLSFMDSDDCLLLRLIDDFLLITTDRSKACKFVEVMHGGLPEYGVTVHPGKSLVNFDLVLDGRPVPRIQDGQEFPYCGTLIDCKLLGIVKDRANHKDPVISDALTVDFSRYPGQNFKRKALNAFKLQSHPMFFDTSHNPPRTVMRNIYDAFAETATKTWAYARCLPRDRQPRPELLIRTIQELIDVAFHLLTGRSRRAKHTGYRCDVTKPQVAWLAMHAFRSVLERKQARYREALAWLDEGIKDLGTKNLGVASLS